MNQLLIELKRDAFQAEELLNSTSLIERPQMLGQALLEAVRGCENANLVRWLIDHSADVNYKTSDASVLSEAVTFVESEKLKALRILLGTGDLKRDDFPEIVMDCVEARVISGAHDSSDDPDAQEALHLLLEAGFLVDHQNQQGNTPLHEAVRYFDTGRRFGQASDLVPISLKHGASPSRKNHKGETPLDLALRTGDDESAKLIRMYFNNPGTR